VDSDVFVPIRQAANAVILDWSAMGLITIALQFFD